MLEALSTFSIEKLFVLLSRVWFYFTCISNNFSFLF